MLDDLVGLIAAITGGASREESFAMRFIFSLIVTVCAGFSCLLFSIFAIHGFYTGDDMSSVIGDFKVAGILALVATASGYIASRWFREDTNLEKSD